MFKNFKAVASMATPIAAIDPIILDSIILAAKTKELLKDEYYAGSNDIHDAETVKKILDPILGKIYGVYCTSAGLGDYREFVGSWVKRWNKEDDDLIDFGKTQPKINISMGRYKNYHMPIVLKAYQTITFYVRGDIEEISRLLKANINYLGKKGSQGYGQIKQWGFEETNQDSSLFKDNKLLRPIPVERFPGIEISQSKRVFPVIPPYWRLDNHKLCYMPEDINEG